MEILGSVVHQQVVRLMQILHQPSQPDGARVFEAMEGDQGLPFGSSSG
jgi:hypothetical protein